GEDDLLRMPPRADPRIEDPPCTNRAGAPSDARPGLDARRIMLGNFRATRPEEERGAPRHRGPHPPAAVPEPRRRSRPRRPSHRPPPVAQFDARSDPPSIRFYD